MNITFLHGCLGSDPDLRQTNSGTAVLKLSLATNERVKRGDTWEDATEWHRVVCFGKRAEGLAKILTKGSRIVVQGKLRTSSYEKDGVKRYSTEIIADEIELAGSKTDGTRRQPAPAAEHDYGAGDEDIPF